MSLLSTKHADEIRDMWQSRLLVASHDKMRKVVIVALAKEYPGAFVTLMKVTFPGFVDFDRPFFSSYASIALSGRIVCDMIDKDGSKRKIAVYRNEDEFIYEMRTLADRLKLSDKDRIEMFTVLQKWVVSDQRVGILGNRLAS
jgi:hypothetical protein